MAVQWADVSYYQPTVTDAYPHPVLAIRSNDGTYRDPKFAANYAWAKKALSTGKLQIIITYCVYRPNWAQTAATMIDMVGTPPHDRFVAMIDVESWQGQITGDQSDGINRLYWYLADWLGDRRRVIGYGNQGDLRTLWPTRPDGVQLVVAAYGSAPPKFPGMIAHQYGDDIHCDPFGPCDGNAANDHDIDSLRAALGLSGGPRLRSAKTSTPEDDMPWRLDPTSAPLMSKADSLPDGSWAAKEDTITLGPAGGWRGRFLEHVTFGNRGGWIQEAWWAPSGLHVVPRDKGLYVPQFSTQHWEAPIGTSALILRYAAPCGGSVSPEPEH
jgi:hypothetical protein